MFYPNITLSKITAHSRHVINITKENNIYHLTHNGNKSYPIDENMTLKNIQDILKTRNLVYRTGLNHPDQHIQNGTLLFHPDNIGYYERDSTSYNEKSKNILEITPIKTIFDHIHPHPFQETIDHISISTHNEQYFIEVDEINNNSIDFKIYTTKEKNHPFFILYTHIQNNMYEIETEYDTSTHNENFTTLTHDRWKNILFSTLKRKGQTEHENIMLLKNISNKDVEKFKTYMTPYLSLFKTINTNKISLHHCIQTEIAKF